MKRLNKKKFKNPKTFKKHLKQLKRLNKRHSKKRKGSNNKEKARIKLAKKHRKIKRIREHNLHQISNQIIDDNQAVFVEDLKSFMFKNKSLAKSAADAAIGKLKEMLKYKAKWNQRTFRLIDPKYTSKTCHCCGWIYKDLKLSEREWTCKSCGEHHDRDINAAINILIRGLALEKNLNLDQISLFGDSLGQDLPEVKLVERSLPGSKGNCRSARHLAGKQEAPVFTQE
jgi:putative transposase